jgi:hypothetical protein
MAFLRALPKQPDSARPPCDPHFLFGCARRRLGADLGHTAGGAAMTRAAVKPCMNANQSSFITLRSRSRNLVWIQEAPPPPSFDQQPGVSRRHGGSKRRRSTRRDRRRCPRPSIEPAPRGRGIDREGTQEGTAGLRRVSARIQEHILERIAHLARRPQRPQVITIDEYGTGAPEDSIHGSGEPRADRLHPASERVFIICFHNQMSGDFPATSSGTVGSRRARTQSRSFARSHGRVVRCVAMGFLHAL